MSLEEILLEAEEQMDNAISALKTKYKTLRTGQASRAIVENINAEYYGAMTSISQMANIATPEPRQIMIKPFDPSCLEAIEKSIQKADLGVNPANDGKVIRLNFPPLTEERRKQVQATAKEEAERAKITIRNARRDANKALDGLQKESAIAEDECYTAKEEVQKLTDKYEKDVKITSEAKITDIMTV